ncbi:MAG: DUF1269 domain-containing protein [Anaerolineae bacterium]|nr:DUF1269 domain-containing protein [Anaerolineae bacterium]
MSETFVGLYKDFNTARKVVEDLVNAGLDRRTISLVASDSVTRYGEKWQITAPKDQMGGADGDVEAAEGAGFGAVVGTLVGLGVALIPGVGPIIAGGALGAAALSAGVGAATGAVTGGIAASLMNFGVPEEDAAYYTEGIRKGGALVGVSVHETWADRVREVMNRHNPIDLDVQNSADINDDTADFSTEQRQQSGGVMAQSASTRGGTYTSERSGVRTYSRPRTFENYAPEYRNHYNMYYGHTGNPYDFYLPAYLYGFNLGSNSYYRGYQWEQIEPEARRRWEEERPNTWDQIKDAVRNAWDSLTD